MVSSSLQEHQAWLEELKDIKQQREAEFEKARALAVSMNNGRVRGSSNSSAGRNATQLIGEIHGLRWQISEVEEIIKTLPKGYRYVVMTPTDEPYHNFTYEGTLAAPCELAMGMQVILGAELYYVHKVENGSTYLKAYLVPSSKSRTVKAKWKSRKEDE